MKLSILLERIFTPPIRRAAAVDRKFTVEWDDGVMQYVVIGQPSGKQYAYFRDEDRAERFISRMEHRGIFGREFVDRQRYSHAVKS